MLSLTELKESLSAVHDLSTVFFSDDFVAIPILVPASASTMIPFLIRSSRSSLRDHTRLEGHGTWDSSHVVLCNTISISTGLLVNPVLISFLSLLRTSCQILSRVHSWR